MDKSQQDPKVNVTKDFGINVGNIAVVKALTSASGLSVGDLNKVQIVEIDIPVPNPWIDVTSFSNSWVNYGGSSPTAAYMKHPDGTVEMKGVIKSGTIGLAAFALPVPFRPGYDRMMATCADSGNAALLVLTTGAVIPFVGSTTWYYINVQFLALDSRPQVLSCFPIQIKTKMNVPPHGVLVLGTTYSEQKRSATILPGAALNSVDWSFVRKADGNYIQIQNITGLPYNQKTKVRLMIIGA